MGKSIEVGSWRVSASDDGHGTLTVEVLLAGAAHATLTFPAAAAEVPADASPYARGHRSYGDVRGRLRADMDI